MTKERDYRLDAAAELITELLERYRLPGQTWDVVFDDEAAGDPEAMDGEDAGRHVREMLEDEGECEGLVAFLKETAAGFITDEDSEEDWRIARAALTLLRGRDGERQEANPHNAGVRSVGQAFEAYKRTGGWRGLDAEAAIATFVEFCEHEIPQGHTVLRRVGRDALVFTSEGSPQPFVVAHGYDEWRGDWGYGSYYGSAVDAWMEIDPDAIEGTAVWWSRSDFEDAIERAGMEADDEIVDDAIDRTAHMRGWRDLATSHGWECIDEVLSDIKEGRS